MDLFQWETRTHQYQRLMIHTDPFKLNNLNFSNLGYDNWKPIKVSIKIWKKKHPTFIDLNTKTTWTIHAFKQQNKQNKYHGKNFFESDVFILKEF